MRSGARRDLRLQEQPSTLALLLDRFAQPRPGAGHFVRGDHLAGDLQAIRRRAPSIPPRPCFVPVSGSLRHSPLPTIQTPPTIGVHLLISSEGSGQSHKLRVATAQANSRLLCLLILACSYGHFIAEWLI